MTQKSNRGFASMDREKQRQIASKGGKAAHAKGTAHEFTQEEARAAGRKGGQAAHQRGTAHEFTPEEAREAGRKGGQSSHTRRSGPHTGGNGEQLENQNGTAHDVRNNNPQNHQPQHQPGPNNGNVGVQNQPAVAFEPAVTTPEPAGQGM
jgi:general stress protein YciG